jgi:hypothetical protein
LHQDGKENLEPVRLLAGNSCFILRLQVIEIYSDSLNGEAKAFIG